MYKSILNIFTTTFILIVFSSLASKGQGSTPPKEYYRNIEMADSLSEKGDFQTATSYYSSAFKAFGGRGIPDDRYKASRAWALIGNKDSLLNVLDYLCNRSRYWNYQRFNDDKAFSSIRGTPKFDELTTCFQKNKEKYFPEINIAFYNALDSIYLEGKQNEKSPALTADQLHYKDSLNLKRIAVLLDSYGWPSKEAVGFWGYSILCSSIKQSRLIGYQKYQDMLNRAQLKENSLFDKKIAAILDTVLIDDQRGRKKINAIQQQYGFRSKQIDSLWKSILYDDSINLVKIKLIIDTYGWLGKEIVGEDGTEAIFLVIQHADLATQEKYLPILRDAVKNGKAYPSSLALLEDRILTRNGKPQIYGSQLKPNPQTGKNEFFPIEDISTVNKRRASVGLSSLEEYAKLMGVDHIPK